LSSGSAYANQDDGHPAAARQLPARPTDLAGFLDRCCINGPISADLGC
jgi:hypothetical protein